MAKKIVLCGPWLTCLLKDIMFKLPPKARKAYQALKGRTVKLVDGSVVSQGGTKGKRGGGSLRVHTCYNMTAGAIDSVVISDKYTAESVDVFEITPGDIIMGDAGYGKGKNLAHVLSHKADALFRISPNQVRLANDIKGISVINMAELISKTVGDTLDFACFIHIHKGNYIPVRIIAGRLPKDKASLAKKRKSRKASKNQNKLQEQTLVFAEWVILMTSLDSYSATELLDLYRARWQIELLFKRIKQAFQKSKLTAASIVHSNVIVLLWLIIWAITEQQALAIEMALMKKGADMSLYSTWVSHIMIFQQLKALINCLWALSFDHILHVSLLFLRGRNHRSCRINHYADFRSMMRF